jgi:ATP-dependent Lon protease
MADTPTSTAAPFPSELPILPIRGAVVLPLTIAPLSVTRPRSIEAVHQALAGNRMLLTLLQVGDAEDPAAGDLARVGTVVLIRQLVRAPEGLRILVEGMARARADSVQEDPALLKATVTPLPERAVKNVQVEAHMRRLQELADRALSLATGLSPEVRMQVGQLDDPLRMCYLLASLLDMKAEDKQRLLEENDVEIKLAGVAQALAREIEVLEVKGKIESEAQQEMSDAQRKYVLRQQMKAIQDELGEGESETAELRRRLEAANLPEAVGKAVRTEIDRLDRMTSASPEYQMIRTYLDWVFDVPWSVFTEDRLDLVEARRALDEDHYDLDKVKERIVEYLAVRKLKGDMKGPILCFVGPPGVGKTSLGQSIARAMSRKFVRISLGGVRDEAEIRGHRRTYIGSMPGRIVQAIKQAGSLNPVFMLDEIDKLAVGFQGDPAAALLEVLDPAQNSTFRDHYLEVAMDLSKVLFITTANQLGTVHPALLDRMEIITLSGYTEEEKVHIATRYLVPRQLAENGLPDGLVTFGEDALRRVISDYTREAGVRNLERQIGTVARKVAARIASSDGGTAAGHAPVAIEADALPGYLGPPRFKSDVAFRTSRPGVATGVAWTETGGDVLFIEAALLPGGKGAVTLTGQLGAVMQESARAALSHIREHATALGVDPELFSRHDLHVHVPAGAIPKDGPSAGVTIATAIVSAARGQPVRSDVAMTGEITLSGLVLPVGGIREKALAARRHEIKTFVLPKMNAVDLEELPEEVRREMTFVPAETLTDVLKVAFET